MYVCTIERQDVRGLQKDTKARGKGLNEENTDCAAAVCPLFTCLLSRFPTGLNQSERMSGREMGTAVAQA